MKKILLFMIGFILPIQVMAYSNYIIPGGETLGIEVNSNGILVIGFYQINGEYNKGTPQIKPGDYITEINGAEVKSIKELITEIEKHVDDGEVNVSFIRNKKTKISTLTLVEDNGVYKTGLYVKDSITGIGTLTYIDPGTKIYGALGHEIVESNTNEIVEIKSGNIFRNSITGIDKSSVGIAGSKNAKFYYDTVYGLISKNTNFGIYGDYTNNLPQKELVEVGLPAEVKIGEATIKTVLDGEKVGTYNIRITAINESSKIKNITFELEDKTLIDKTGGIVQGMSGSPIFQNGKIVGAVTHVIVDNPLTGYGIFITTMLEEGEK